jgi:hypothetical protein
MWDGSVIVPEFQGNSGSGAFIVAILFSETRRNNKVSYQVWKEGGVPQPCF